MSDATSIRMTTGLDDIYNVLQAREFSSSFDRPINEKLAKLTPEERVLLGSLLLEETLEYCFKGLGLALHADDMIGWHHKKYKLKVRPGAKVNPIEIADGLGDVNVIIWFNSLWHGFDLNKVTLEIHRSNMSKLDEDGLPVINECGVHGTGCKMQYHSCELIDPTRPAGKILKGPDYSPPNLLPILGLIPDEEEE